MSVDLEREFNGNHIKEIFNKLNRDRIDEKRLCDVTINAKFSAHKPVLVLFCEFFEKLFMSEMKEKYTSSGNIQDVSHKIMEIILSYIYTEKIVITKENVYDVLAAANYMHIPDLLKFCGKFLNEILDVSNCVNILAYLRMYNQNEWAANSTTLVAENFEKLVKLHSFNSLRFDDFEFVLQLKNKKYSCEEVVYEAVINWVNNDVDQRHAYLYQLFQYVDLSRVSANFLQEVLMTEILIINSVECMKTIVITAINMNNSQSTSSQTQKPIGNNKTEQNKNKSPKKQNERTNSNKVSLFDQYDYQDFDEVEVSKELVRILRHGKYKAVKLDKYGYCFLEDITHCKRFLDRFGKIELANIDEIVNYSDKKRFELQLDGGRVRIRAIDKHSIEVEDVNLVEISDTERCELYHGTSYDGWDLIRYDGLSRKRKNYIHFTKGMNMARLSKYDIIIKLNMEMAIQDGFKFYIEQQGGVVCRGDRRGKISRTYFSLVKEMETNERIHFRMPRDYGEN